MSDAATKAAERILADPEARRLKARLCALIDDFLLHDGFGHLELDMRILTRRQKEFILRAGKEYRFVVDFLNGSPQSSCEAVRCPLRERERPS